MKKVGTVRIKSAAIGSKQRGVIRAVRHNACRQCGGAWWDRSLPRPVLAYPAYPCDCPGGWVGKVENLGVLADSGPTDFFPRLVWKFQQWLAGLLGALREKAA